MNFKHLLLGLLSLVTSATAIADEPFRLHRYDALKALPVTSDQIMFIGNSITNMHEWWEAFGSDNRIVNRGNSGCSSQEIIDNLESFIDGKPAKVFLMVGTNDISSGVPYQTVVNNIRTIIDRIQAESPATEIYVQSILPRVHEPQCTNNKAANVLIAALCQEKGATYIDLWDDLIGVRDYGQWSADGLHLYATGYRVWCRKIAPYLGDDFKCVYEDSFTNVNGGVSNSFGMRNSYFGMLPVKATDVLIIGDEMIHGGEWHELLRSDRIKNRGTGWGYGGITLAQHKTNLTAILESNGNKVAPAKIFFFCGTADKNTTDYKAMLNEAKRLAPTSKLYVMSQIPLSNNSNSAVVSFNNSLKTIAEEIGATYVDIYTPLQNASGNTDTECITANYLYGRGYIKVANILAKYLEEEGVNPVSIDEFEALNSQRTSRNSLLSAISAAEAISFGDSTGEYPASAQALIESAVNKAKDLLNSPELSPEAAAEAARAINNALTDIREMINMPKPSKGDENHYYTFCSSLRGSYFTTASAGALIGVAGGVTTAERLWEFTERADGTFNIVNLATGQFVSPTAAYNTQIKLSDSEPSAGWKLSYSNTPGMYTIYSGTSCQLNQTNLNAAVYNWYTQGSMPDRNDQGCQLTVSEFEGELAKPVQLETGWYRIELANDHNGYVSAGTHHMLNAEDEYRQTDQYYYSLKFSSINETNPATAFIHLTVNGTKHQFTGLCGHGVKENCTSDRSSLSSDNPAVAQSAVEGAWTIGKWSDFTNTGSESPYVGKSSASNNSYYLNQVTAEELDGYDIYTVIIKNATNGSEIGQDARLGLDIAANKGIRKVYNQGTFFLTKGTVLEYDMFTPDTNNGKSDPEITVDEAAKTITVDYSISHDPMVSIKEIAVPESVSGTMFDLQGRKINRTQNHGIYVIDGRKIRL